MRELEVQVDDRTESDASLPGDLGLFIGIGVVLAISFLTVAGGAFALWIAGIVYHW